MGMWKRRLCDLFLKRGAVSFSQEQSQHSPGIPRSRVSNWDLLRGACAWPAFPKDILAQNQPAGARPHSPSSTAGLPASPAGACLAAGLAGCARRSAAGVVCASPSAPVSETSGIAAWACLQHRKMSKENVASKARSVTPQSLGSDRRL